VLTDLNAIIMGLVCVATLFVMVRWHLIGHGAWRCYSSGRSVMTLLACITAITALACVSTFTGPFPARPYIYTVLYCALLVAVSLIGSAIITAQRDRTPPESRSKETS
jgi:cation transport ATPase